MTAVASGGARVIRPGLVIGVCLLIATLEGYDVQAFGVAAPHMARELGLNPGQVGWAGSAANFGLVLGALAGGWAADRWGRKPVLLASVLAFGLFSLATAFAQGVEPLLAARFLTGLGFGGVMPNLIALAAEIAAPGRRAAMTSAMFCGMPAGGAAVSLLARLAGEHADWRLLFLVGGGLPLLIAPLMHWGLPETRPQPAAHLDRGLARALFGEGRLGSTLLLWAASLLTLIVLHLLLNWLPILVAAKGHSAADGAAASLAFNVAGVVGALALGVAADRAGARRTMAVAFLALGAAMWAIGAATGQGPILVTAGVAGFMLIGALYVLYGLAPGLYPAQVRSAAAGAAVGVGRVGSILGPLVAGQLRQAGWSAGHVLDAMVPVALAAGAAVVALTYLGKLHDR
jgi:MFS transporter, AAHS family, 3-hydroxyphenylpropionic acid transporter